MKPRTRLLATVIAAASLALTVPLTAHADPLAGGPGCGMTHERGMRHGAAGMGAMGPMGEMRMLRELDLTEAQRDRIFELRHEQAPKMRALWKEVRDSHRAMRDLAFSEGYSEAKAAEIAARGAKAMASIGELRSRLEAGVFATLDDKQRAELKQRMDAQGDAHRDGMRHHPMDHGLERS